MSEDNAVAVCTECGTVVPDQVAFKDPFLQEGKPSSCRMCGGVVVVMLERTYKSELNRINQSRGIPKS